MYEGSDLETESNIPILYTHGLNECLSLIPGYAINVEKKVGRHKLIHSYMLSLKIK